MTTQATKLFKLINTRSGKTAVFDVWFDDVYLYINVKYVAKMDLPTARERWIGLKTIGYQVA